jgi:hypothetical protein
MASSGWSSGVLSPAISGEESGRLLRDWRVWGALQSRGVTGGGESVVVKVYRKSTATSLSPALPYVTTCR